MVSTSMNEAVRAGLAQGKQELSLAGEAGAATEQRQKNTLSAAFDTAACLVEGLELLRDRPSSAFTFNILPLGNEVFIDTNIPAEDDFSHIRHFTLNISCRGDGSMTVRGDRDDAGKCDEASAQKGAPGAAEKIVAFAASYAAKRGIVP